MLAKDMFEFRDDLNQRGVIFCYSGFVTEEVLTGIAKALRTKLELDDTDSKTAKSLFSVFVEQVQNVVRYSAEREADSNDENELRYGVITVGRKDEKYFVSCGNMIREDDVARLKESLTRIQGLDKDGLKALYKETLKGETPEGSKGAGVGFIDIARRASHGFLFDFMPVDGDHSYFCLQAFV